MPQSRRLAAIMFTDVVGYTAMMQENREATMTTTRGFNPVLASEISLSLAKS